MFFMLSKLLDVALDPLWWAMGALLAGLALIKRRPRAGLAALALGTAVLLLFSTPMVAQRLWFGLEHEPASSYRADVTYDTVVLLGGVVDPAGSTAAEAAYGNNIERLLTVFELLRTDRAKTAILSGGYLSEGLPSEAAYLQRELVAWGIAPERLLLDERSKNTHENAVQTAALVSKHGFRTVLMVTSAFHMQRAKGCFNAVSLAVDTLPVDFRLRALERSSARLPRAEYLGESAQAVREYAGRLIYRMLGYSQ